MNKIHAIVALFFLVGCASSGVKVSQDAVDKLQRGKTTYADVIQSLGRPTGSGTMPDGSRYVSYHYFSAQARPETFIPIVGVFAGGADTESSSVMIFFDKDGVIKNFTSNQSGMGSGSGFEAMSQERKDIREVK